MIPEAIALAGCSLAIYYDRGSNPHVPNAIPLALALVGVVGGQWRGYGVPWAVLVLALLWLWRRGLGGGDVKLLIGVGMVLPSRFPFVVLGFAVAGFLYGLWAYRAGDYSERPFAWAILIGLLFALL